MSAGALSTLAFAWFVLWAMMPGTSARRLRCGHTVEPAHDFAGYECKRCNVRIYDRNEAR